FEEINQKKKVFRDFIVLRRRNFNKRKKWGLLILKFKDHPLVLKVFMENPKGFVSPYSKGFEPIFFFNMGGGANRHLLGFTRVKNLQYIESIIKKDAYWSEKITTPRKWFWLPKNPKYIELVGRNISGKKLIIKAIPGTYCIIADAITPAGKKFSIFNKAEREQCMTLCNFLDISIDPHIDNYMIEKGTDKIAIVDTEHFPTLVGFKKKYKFTGYWDWYWNLSKKCMGDLLLRSKRDRFG
ncbi:unnamed protein product, partial [marine sediment metagenome]